jgi:hypothetical protein
MRLWSRLRSWVRAILRRSHTESEMYAELHFHIEAYVEDLILPAQGGSKYLLMQPPRDQPVDL